MSAETRHPEKTSLAPSSLEPLHLAMSTFTMETSCHVVWGAFRGVFSLGEDADKTTTLRGAEFGPCRHDGIVDVGAGG